ncbi:MAG: nucleoside-diphosphate kinase [Candidatus Saccharimonadales bacterium]
MERTLILAKPDAVQRGLVGEIITRFERKGLKLIGLKMISVDDEILEQHYSHLTDKPFFSGIKSFMKSSPLVAMAWEGYECTASVRVIVGATNPRAADAGTIRGDFAMGQGRNLIHASDNAESGMTEVERFFSGAELFSYDKSEYLHVYEDNEREGRPQVS